MAKRPLVVLSAFALAASLAGIAGAQPPDRSSHVPVDSPLGADEGLDQHGGTFGHLFPSPLSQNVTMVGHFQVSDAAPGLISDVGVFRNTAYLGQFNPGCTADGAGGVYVIDISQPAAPTQIGFIETPGTFVGEGVQALRLSTSAFKGDLLVVNGESCGSISNRIGGFSLYDVTNPAAPVTLVENVGDVNTVGGVTRANQIHSAFAWQQGKKAYVVIVDDEETTDVDIFDITNPMSPVFIEETGLGDWPGAQDAQSAGIGSFPASFFHDVVVKKVRGHWQMLLSYWDAGYVILNVDDPANTVFVDDTTFTDPDPQTGLSPPEGNGHQAEWNLNSQFFLGSDEDFSHSQVTSFTSGAFVGSRPATEGAFTAPIVTFPGSQMTGEVVFVGRGCPVGSIFPGSPEDPYLADPTGKIALIERGACRFDNKIARAQLAGATGAVVFNNAAGGEGLITMGGNNPVVLPDGTVVQITIPGVFVQRSTGILLRDGTLPVTATAVAQFNGWGYIHLFDAKTLAELDTFAIPEALDPAFAGCCGNLTNHEIATSEQDPSLAYLSWYDAGFRVIRFGSSGISQVGYFVDANGNDFWGVQVFKSSAIPDTELVAASDRDSGLWIFRYTGP